MKAFYAELATLLSSSSTVVVGGFSQTEVIAATSDAVTSSSTSPRASYGSGVLSVPLLPVTDVVARRDMLVMKSALIRSAVISSRTIAEDLAAEKNEQRMRQRKPNEGVCRNFSQYADALMYYELLKSSPGVLGSVLQAINSTGRTVFSAVQRSDHLPFSW